MQVNHQTLSNIKAAVLKTHSLHDFIQLAESFADRSGVSFQNDIAPAAYSVSLGEYLEKLNYKGMVLRFIQLYTGQLNPDQKALPEVKNICEQIAQSFVENNNTWQIAPSHFDSCLVKKNFAFLSRKNVRSAVRAMINDKDSPILVIQGKPKSGLSYIYLYLSEFETNFEIFRIIEVNLKKKVADYTNGLIYAAHMAQYIAENVGMNHTIDAGNPEQFKSTPFLTKLKIHLNSTENTYLLFIDQFDTPLADDVFSLISGLAELSMNNPKLLVVLAGFNKLDEWSFLLEHTSVKVDIENGYFSKEHVQEFFGHVYTELQRKFGALQFTKDEFFNQVSTIIPDADFTIADTNVTVVGQKLSKWYRNLYETIKSNV